MRREREAERVAEFGGIVVAGFVAAVLVLYAFGWLADEVLEQQTATLDSATGQLLQRFSSAPLTLAAQAISLMGSQVVLVATVLLLALFAWQRRWTAALMLVLVIGGAQLLNDLFKEVFQRARPTPVSGFLDAQQFSFPSGHAMVSAAFYFYVAYLTWELVHGWWRAALVIGLVVLVLLIGVSRVYLEVHYLSDVLAGYLAGFVWTDAVIIGSQVLSLRSRQRLSPRKVNW